MRNESVLNVWTSDFEDMRYNLKRDGWLNNFTDVKNQSMRDNGVPWRSAHEKRRKFFSILLSALTDKDDIVFDWQCGVGSLFISMFLMYLFSDVLILFVFVSFPIHFLIITFPHLFVLGGSIIVCRSIQRHIVAHESDIDVFKSILLPICEPEQEHTSQQATPQQLL